MLNNGHVVIPAATNAPKDDMVVWRCFLHFALFLKSQYWISVRFALHIQHIFLACHPANPNNVLNQGQSPLHCSKVAQNGNCLSGCTRLRRISLGSHGFPSCLALGANLHMSAFMLYTNISNIAFTVCRPKQPHLQKYFFSRHVKRILSSCCRHGKFQLIISRLWFF